jgi:hypothetical protein
MVSQRDLHFVSMIGKQFALCFVCRHHVRLESEVDRVVLVGGQNLVVSSCTTRFRDARILRRHNWNTWWHKFRNYAIWHITARQTMGAILYSNMMPNWKSAGLDRIF